MLDAAGCLVWRGFARTGPTAVRLASARAANTLAGTIPCQPNSPNGCSGAQGREPGKPTNCKGLKIIHTANRFVAQPRKPAMAGIVR